MKSKKGVSPIISMVLLVAFVIIISVVVMAWIRSGVETQMEKGTEQMETATECYLTKITIPPASQKGACYTGTNAIKIIVDNEGKRDVLGVTTRIIYTDANADVEYEDLSSSILAQHGRAVIPRASLTQIKDNIESVEVIPHITDGSCKGSGDILTVPATGLLAC